MIECFDDALFAVTTGNEDNRGIGSLLVAQPVEFLDARGIGQMPVEHEQIEFFPGHRFAKTFTRRKRLQLVARLGGPQANQFDLTQVVFQQSNAHETYTSELKKNLSNVAITSLAMMGRDR